MQHVDILSQLSKAFPSDQVQVFSQYRDPIFRLVAGDKEYIVDHLGGITEDSIKDEIQKASDALGVKAIVE